MRLDAFLKKSSILKRRTVAKELCDNGKVLVNGKEGKPSLNLKDGDVISLLVGNSTREFIVHIETLDNGKENVSYVRKE
ncbi:MAG: RNA-binding S4 domain-containing protein [Coprobacillus sp.]|nr:RNA-binding S4 domain-containing protein [Coprobacillus sp.]